MGQLLTGLGLGSLITSLISLWLIQRWEKKKLIYQTKLDLYSNFIDSYQESAAKPKDETLRQLCVAMQKKLELIAPKIIVDLSRKFYESPPRDGVEIRDKLIKFMRIDLENL